MTVTAIVLDSQKKKVTATVLNLKQQYRVAGKNVKHQSRRTRQKAIKLADLDPGLDPVYY